MLESKITKFGLKPEARYGRGMATHEKGSH